MQKKLVSVLQNVELSILYFSTKFKTKKKEKEKETSLNISNMWVDWQEILQTEIYYFVKFP